MRSDPGTNRLHDTHAATNGIDTAALAKFVAGVAGVAADPARAGVRFDVLSTWQGGTRSRAVTQPMQLGGERIERRFTIEADERRNCSAPTTPPIRRNC